MNEYQIDIKHNTNMIVGILFVMLGVQVITGFTIVWGIAKMLDMLRWLVLYG